jgi:hypothetical protein
MVQMAGHNVIRMSGVGNGFMPAAGAVSVGALVLAALVLGGAAVGILGARGQLMAVYMIVMQVVHVTLVQIVGVTVVLDALMPASFTVCMSVALVGLAVHGVLLVTKSMLARFSRNVCAEVRGRQEFGRSVSEKGHQRAAASCKRAAV